MPPDMLHRSGLVTTTKITACQRNEVFFKPLRPTSAVVATEAFRFVILVGYNSSFGEATLRFYKSSPYHKMVFNMLFYS